MLLLNEHIRLQCQRRGDVQLMLVLIDELAVLLRIDGGMRRERMLVRSWRPLLGLCMVLSLLLL